MKRRPPLCAGIVAATVWAGASAFGQTPPSVPAPAQTPIPNQAASSPLGSLSIRVTQGTPGEPPIGVIPVEVQLFHRGMLLDTIRTETDEHGIVLIEQISIAMPVQPLVKVNFATLDYQVGGGMLDAEHAHQEIEVVCFASTEVAPTWTVPMRHVMAVPEAGGLRVTEMMVVRNPDHRTWVGQKSSGPKLNTTSFVLPAEAKDVQLGRGFHKWCCSTLINGSLVNHIPLMPESSEMTFSYLMPSTDGVVKLELTAPSAVDNTMLVLPSTLQAETLQRLSVGGEQKMGESTVRVFMAAPMTAGQKATITIGGVPQMAATNGSAGGAQPAGPAGPAAMPAAPSAQQTQSPAGAGAAKIVAGIGGALVVILALVIFLRKPGTLPMNGA